MDRTLHWLLRILIGIAIVFLVALIKRRHTNQVVDGVQGK